MTAGKWQNGDQITQLKQDDEGVVMRRRTVTKGGSLSGAAHPDVKPETEYDKAVTQLATNGYAKPGYSSGYPEDAYAYADEKNGKYTGGRRAQASGYGAYADNSYGKYGQYGPVYGSKSSSSPYSKPKPAYESRSYSSKYGAPARYPVKSYSSKYGAPAYYPAKSYSSKYGTPARYYPGDAPDRYYPGDAPDRYYPGDAPDRYYPEDAPVRYPVKRPSNKYSPSAYSSGKGDQNGS